MVGPHQTGSLLRHEGSQRSQIMLFGYIESQVYINLPPPGPPGCVCRERPQDWGLEHLTMLILNTTMANIY